MFDSFNQYFNDAPAQIHPKELLRYYFALNDRYQIDNNQMPLPIFRRHGLKDEGSQVWKTLLNYNGAAQLQHPMVIYVHVPYCPSRCAFCDCLTTPLYQNSDGVLDHYLDHLSHEIKYWGQCGTLPRRPVSTVHFGGGTPLFLGAERFQTLCKLLKDTFNITASTEWAIETTTSSLTPETIDTLTSIGFRRLHLGIQSMEDSVRVRLKRRETTETLLEKLKHLIPDEWVTTVDLLVGLPQETLPGVIGGIESLIETGIDGFSVYEIHFSSQNQSFAEQYQLPANGRLNNYFLFLAATQYLLHSGYSKNLFNHFANQRDQNLYFTFPQRNEDCLAIGAYADGVFGDYHYRNLPTAAYSEQQDSAYPPFHGGIREDSSDQLLKQIETAVLSGGFGKEEFLSVLPASTASQLLKQWEACLLIEQESQDHFVLTPNGAWFSGNMIRDLHEAVRK